eukprot:gnl/MRDRNA2_/MRDRNA2_159862_c0_seq1.p1 gnl/MRDRNA2_/MRDRNA2_159862_c0~~gnl/MRDRNA2_/MRDRNA2_159862_c0_seq1.p1  ORF type:complete len:339 (+),score=50.12 gnl/MRDRNA2_/MRDRNA2_159862_c0_seq1:113-1129(+)
MANDEAGIVKEAKLEEVTAGLEFPEGGPIYLNDGSLLLVEIKRGTLTRVLADGSKFVVAHLGGGPNSSAAGPDGSVLVTQNGGFTWAKSGPWTVPAGVSSDYTTGAIENVDIHNGTTSVLYTKAIAADGKEVQLKGPNDLVLDASGGFWFTDLGKTRARDMDLGGVYYAMSDGSLCKEMLFPMPNPNGIGLSPDGTSLYVAETTTGKLLRFDVESPGVLKQARREQGDVLYTAPDFYRFDSLAVDSEGNICVATLGRGRFGLGGISVIRPDGSGLYSFIPTGDPMTTNISFGGPDHRDAYITLSGTGRLVKTLWHCPGHRCHFESKLRSDNIHQKSAL